MTMSKYITEIRILVFSLIFSLGILSYTIYNSYADDIKQRVSEKIVEYLPEMDNDLAGI
jgi:hypothetical protein